MRFSQRYGYTPIRDTIQLESADEALRSGLWDILKISYWDRVQCDGELIYGQLRLSAYGSENVRDLCQRLWHGYFKKPTDTVGDLWEDVYSLLRKYFFAAKWFEVYDFIEFVAGNYPDEATNSEFMKAANGLLEREMSGYRFVDGHIAQITDASEIAAIEAAVGKEQSPVRAHMEAAVRLLFDRKSPDYRNSIKESISAVESLVKAASASKNGTLGALLKQLSQRQPIHPALSDALSKLYGYASDANGVRHSLIEEDRV